MKSSEIIFKRDQKFCVEFFDKFGFVFACLRFASLNEALTHATRSYMRDRSLRIKVLYQDYLSDCDFYRTIDVVSSYNI